MPIYEYKCKVCGDVTEVLQRVGTIQDPPACQACGSKNVERMFSSSFISMVAGSGSEEASGCCGLTNPCDNPKRCCGTE